MKLWSTCAIVLASSNIVGLSAAPAPSTAGGAIRSMISYQEVAGPDGSVMLFAVARPKAHKRLPVILILHGTHGFADEYVELAQMIASKGYVAVAACWFAPGRGAGMRFITPRQCPAKAPPIADGDTIEAQARIELLLRTVRGLPSVRPDNVFLMGHSRGGVAALWKAFRGRDLRGAILNSAAYPPETLQKVSDISTPVLILHGERDGPADGGSDMTAISRARAFADELKRAGKRVDTRIYERGGHNSLFVDARQKRAEVNEIAKFMRANTSD